MQRRRGQVSLPQLLPSRTKSRLVADDVRRLTYQKNNFQIAVRICNLDTTNMKRLHPAITAKDSITSAKSHFRIRVGLAVPSAPHELGKWVCSFLLLAALAPLEADPIDIGSRRELLVDEHCIDRFKGDAKLHLHRPIAKEIVFTGDRPWEGNTCSHFTVFPDGDLFRMYYRAQDYDEVKGRPNAHKFICYAESDDAINWRRPSLGIFEFNGSSDNNIILNCLQRTASNGAFAVFKDSNPDCPDESRYKAMALHRVNGRGLYPFHSADAVHWSLMKSAPGITQGAFDSQNLAFWDPVRMEYRVYWRYFTKERIRAIRTAVSKDFLNWTEPVELTYPGAPDEQLYTNAIRPYHRAPHLFIGFPTRLVIPRGDLTEGLFMTSRDAKTFHRWGEAIIPPGVIQSKWHNRSNYIWWGLIETRSPIEGAPPELSLFCHEAYYRGAATQLRRYTYRLDGFVSARAPLTGGEVLTKPLVFSGSRLHVNYASSAAGGLQVEIQDAKGQPIDGFELENCPEIYGDTVNHIVAWKSGQDLSRLKGSPVRLRLRLRDADLYSFQFQ